MKQGLIINSLKKQFTETVALDGINLDISRGKIIAFLGPNGAGKSTLIRLLSGVMKPTSGTANIYGFDLISQSKEVKRITGLLPEEYALYEKLSIFEYVEFIGSLYDLDQVAIKQRFEYLANKLELIQIQNRLIETLSKGQRQKVAIIAAIIHEPKILFLDEPLANLDIVAQRVVKDLILKYKADDRVIIIATHLIYNVKSLADIIVLIDKGKIIFNGTKSEFQGISKSLEDAYISLLGVPN